MGIPDHLTCLLINLYRGQEATVRTPHGTTDWFQIGKGVCQVYILSPCLLNLHAEYILRNAGLEELQAGIKTDGRNRITSAMQMIPPLWQKTKKNQRFLMKVKEESQKFGLQPSLQKTKIMASSPITSWQIDGKTVEAVAGFIVGGSKISADGYCSHEIKRCLLLGRIDMTNLDSILKSRDISCQLRSVYSMLWFFQYPCMNVRVGPE